MTIFWILDALLAGFLAGMFIANRTFHDLDEWWFGIAAVLLIASGVASAALWLAGAR